MVLTLKNSKYPQNTVATPTDATLRKNPTSTTTQTAAAPVPPASRYQTLQKRWKGIYHSDMEFFMLLREVATAKTNISQPDSKIEATKVVTDALYRNVYVSTSVEAKGIQDRYWLLQKYQEYSSDAMSFDVG